MPRNLLLEVLRDVSIVRSFAPKEWDLLVRQGRVASLLGRIHELLFASGLMDIVPAAPLHHLNSAAVVAVRQADSIRWEVECVRRALSSAGIDFVLLKGAAYVMTEAWAARGRTLSDLDILVRKSSIEDAESTLTIHGWQGSHHNAHDQRYYREWMHEIPPMVHVKRGTTIDLHHAILPETARVKVNTSALFDNVLPVPGLQHVFVLPPADMILHSATHLFHEGELDKGLRDLSDIDLLFRQYGRGAAFWADLVARSVELGLQLQLYYAVRYASMLFDTPVPPDFQLQLERFSPSGMVQRMMDYCYLRALNPNHATCRIAGDSLARWSLLARSHWIKMPIHLLGYHFGVKALSSWSGDQKRGTG